MRSNTQHRVSLARLSLVALLIGACAPDESTAPIASMEPPPPGGSTLGRLRAEGYPTVGEIRSGWVLGRDGRPMPVTYEVQDGDAIWQGDIVLGRADQISTTAEGAKPYMRVARDVSARVGTTI